MNHEILEIRNVGEVAMSDTECVISYEDLAEPRVQSNTVFTAASNNNYTNNHLNPDTCCGCTSQ